MISSKLRNEAKLNGEMLFYIIPTLIMFGIIYICSLTFKYVEGDDASSVAFHALGRNPDLQPPYSPYHGMMDVFLNFLPANESVVRHVAVSLTAATSVIAFLLVIDLIKDWLPNLRGFRLTLTTIFLLLCIPEIFYLSLFYTPSLTALFFVLVAHKLLKLAINPQNGLVKFNSSGGVLFILSIIIFGIGTACRWDIGSYLIVILADLIFNNYTVRENFDGEPRFDTFGDSIIAEREPLNYQRIRLAVFFGAAAFLASILAIFFSGCELGAIISIFRLAGEEVSSQDSIFATIGAFQTFFTPAFVIFFSIGFVWLVIRRKKSAAFVFLTVLPFLIWTFSREPKMILPALPSLFLAAAVGVNFVWFEISQKYKVWFRILAVIVIILPWLIGIHVNSPNTSWGPGFEVRTLDTQENSRNAKNTFEDKNQEKQISIKNFKIVFGSGFAVPTPEGPRPLGGHFHTLIGDGWKTFVRKSDEEKALVLQKAFAENMNILQDDRNSGLVTKLLEAGYITGDPRNKFSDEGVNDRFFYNEKQSVHLQSLRTRSTLFSKKMMSDLAAINPNKKIVLYSGYSSTIRKLIDTAPNAIQILGPSSAILDLEEFVKSDRLRE